MLFLGLYGILKRLWPTGRVSGLRVLRINYFVYLANVDWGPSVNQSAIIDHLLCFEIFLDTCVVVI